MTGNVKVKYYITGAITLAIIGSLSLLWLALAASQQAPDVSLKTLRGETLNIAALRGRPVLVSFWATTCPGCIKEIPQLAELYRQFSPQGLEIIGVAMAFDPPNQVVALSKARRIPYPIALDINSEVARAFGGIELTPTTFLIGPDGRMILRKAGPLDIHKVQALVAGMLTNADTGEKRFRIN